MTHSQETQLSEKTYIDWAYIFVAYLSLMGLGFLDNLRAPFLGEITKTLNVTDSLGALFYVVPSMVAYFSSMYTPKLLLKMNTLATLRLGLLFMFVGFLGFSQMLNLAHLVLSGILFGIGFGVVSVAQNIAVSEGSSSHYRKRLFSGLHSIYALASLLAPFIVNLFVAQKLTWSQIYLFLSFVPLFFALSTLFVKKREYQSFHSDNLKLTPKHKRLSLILSISFTFYLCSEIGLASRMVLYLTRSQNLDLVNANQFLAAFFFFLFLSRLIFAIKSFPLSSINILKISLVLSFLFILLGLQFSPWFFTFCGLAMGPFFPIKLEYVTECFQDFSSKVMAQLVAVGSLGVVALHYGLGLITQYLGVQMVLFLVPILLLISLLMLLFFHLEYKKLKAKL